MELDDFKKQTSTSLSGTLLPDAKKNTNQENLVNELQDSLKKKRKKIILIITMLIFLSFVYFLQMITINQLVKTGLGITIAGLLLEVAFLFSKLHALKDSLFLLPTRDFILQAEKNLTYINKTDCLIIIFLLIILGTGGGYIFITRMLRYFTDDFYLLLTIWIIFFIALSIFGFYAGKKDWNRENGKLLAEIKRFRETMADGDSEESSAEFTENPK